MDTNPLYPVKGGVGQQNYVTLVLSETHLTSYFHCFFTFVKIVNESIL